MTMKKARSRAAVAAALPSGAAPLAARRRRSTSTSPSATASRPASRATARSSATSCTARRRLLADADRRSRTSSSRSSPRAAAGRIRPRATRAWAPSSTTRPHHGRADLAGRRGPAEPERSRAPTTTSAFRRARVRDFVDLQGLRPRTVRRRQLRGARPAQLSGKPVRRHQRRRAGGFLNPDLMLYWIGNNDVLGAATRGVASTASR